MAGQQGVPVRLIGSNGTQALHEQEIHVKSGPKSSRPVGGAIVYTETLRDYDTGIIPFFNPVYGIAMNQAVTFSGTPLSIHDGEDKTQWTANPIAGGGAWVTDNNNLHAKDAVVTVLDYTGLSGETITISINGVVTVITEGVDYSAVTSNAVTAANIATAMDAVVGINATSSAGVVTLLAQDTYDIDNLTENSAVSDLTVSARSIRATATTNNDVLEIITTGADEDMSNYSSLTAWIYLTSWSTNGTKDIEFELWHNGAMAPNTIKVGLSDNIDTTNFNQWQKITLGLGSFNGSASTIDSIRIRTVDIGGGPPPDYWLDYIQIQEFGAPIPFELALQKDTVFHIDTLRFQIAGPLTGNFPNNLSYDKILNVVGLVTGCTLQRTQRGQTQFAISLKNLSDFIEAGADLKNGMSDGTNTHITLEVKLNEELFILRGNKADSMSFTINDDLSALTKFTMFAIGRTEI